jgi:RNA polymerase sigma factor (sigma-70 family)
LERASRIASRRYPQLSDEYNDIASEIAIALLGTLKTGENSKISDDNLPAYAYVAARNQARNFVRRMQRSKRIAEHLKDSPSKTEEHPLDNQDQLTWALGKIDKHQRELLELFYLQRLPAEEVGARLGLSAAGVRKRAQRAMQALEAVAWDWVPVTTPTVPPVVASQPAAPDDVPAEQPVVAPRSDVAPLVEVYFAGDNFSSREMALFLDYLSARYRELGGPGLTVVEGQTLVAEGVGVPA